MEQNIDIMRRTIELGDTCAECLSFLISAINKGEEDLPWYLLIDFSQAIMSINNAIMELDPEICIDGLGDAADAVAIRVEKVSIILKAGDKVLAKTLVEDLLPTTDVWRQQLYDCFSPYLIN